MCGLLLTLSVKERTFVRRSGLLTGLAMGHKARGMAHVHEHGVLEKMISRYQGSIYRSHSMVWAVKTEIYELKLLLKQKNCFSFSKKTCESLYNQNFKK